MNEMLQEFVDSRGVSIRIDRPAGVIRGVKILGLRSRNGRSYLPEALVEAVGLYENAKVNVNHPKGNPGGPRDYQDRIGVIRNVGVRPSEGLFADFHFNPKHVLAEQLAWDAEHAPENVGFSHNVQARTARRGDRVVVETITQVKSVDLVADPATTRGLFESTDARDANETRDANPERATKPNEKTASSERPERPDLAELTLEALKQHRPDLVEALAAEQVETVVAEQAACTTRLEAEIDRLRAAEAAHVKQATVRRLLNEFQLPDPKTATPWAKSVVSDRFLESLLAAPDEEAMRQLVEDRAQLVQVGSTQNRGNGRPESRDQNRLDETVPADAETFVKSIT